MVQVRSHNYYKIILSYSKIKRGLTRRLNFVRVSFTTIIKKKTVAVQLRFGFIQFYFFDLVGFVKVLLF